MKITMPSMTIGRKLTVVGLLALGGLILMEGLSLNAMTSSLMENRRQNVQQQVETAYGLLEHFQAQARAGTLSEPQARSAAIAALKDLRYGAGDYFWINDMQPVMVMHPTKPALDGKDLSGVKDPDGVYLFRAFVDTVQRQQGGFVAYQWPKPGKDRPQPKISYVKGFVPWGWIVGSGIYVDDVNEAFWSQARTLLWQGLVLVVLIGLVMWVVSRRLVRNLRRGVGVAEAIAAGNLDNALLADTADETGELLRALDRMRERLRESTESMRVQLTENGRLRLALDKVRAPVTLSDHRNLLIYMNEAAHTLFDGLAEHIRAEGRAFTTDGLLGTSLADFFPGTELRRAYQVQLTETKESRLSAWGRSIRLVSTPIRDPDGSYQGRVTQWVDITEELAEQQREQARIAEERQTAAANLRLKVALDNVSSNVMVADASHHIIYMNDTALKLFSAAEADIRKEIPGFAAGRIVGADIDLFHQQPSHQRAILERLTGTHRAGFEVGGHSMRFVANPVLDAEGRRLGTVVEWTDRTAEVAVEREIDGIVAAAQAGDLTRRIELSGKEGFFKGLGEGINALIDRMERVFTDIATVMGLLAQGDLSRPMSAAYQGTFGKVKDDINDSLGHLGGVVQQLREAADVIATAADEITAGNTNLSGRTEQQASSLEETASSMEELTSTVRHNADNAQQANQLAGNARSKAEQGGEVVQRAVGAMEAINAASGRIAEIIGVIDEIAFQTNLLALNASVEAARAGEQGRGFAVVATEVRNLASRSAAAAKEIKELIRDSVDKVKTGSALVGQSGATLGEIVGAVKKVGDIVAEIAAASSEQSAGIDQVNQAVTSMDEVTQQNAALAEETSAASASLNDKAKEMHELMSFFKVVGDTGRAGSGRPPAVARPAASPGPSARSPARPAVPLKPAAAAARPAGPRPVAAARRTDPAPAARATQVRKVTPAPDEEKEWEEF